MSLRAMRGSLIATAAVGGSLALAASASAIQIPIGSSSDAPYSGSGKPASIYSLYNASSDALLLAENLIYTTGLDTTNFSTKFTSASQLSTTNVPEIAADFAVTATSNQTNFYKLDTAWCETPIANGGAGDSTAVCTSNGGVPPTTVTSAFTGTVQPGVASAASSWPQLSGLVGNLGAITGAVLNSADSASISSAGTVTAANAPINYSITLSAPAGGYILPSAFTLTFPAGLSVNTALVGAEVNAAANGTTAADVAAVEADPTGTAIGTVTVKSPVADSYGGSNNQLVGKVYAVQTGVSSGQGSVTQPFVELWFAPSIYTLGSFPGSLGLPLTLQFGVASTPKGPVPLPFSSLTVSFPAATSPVKATTCTTLGTVRGTATDEVANLAYEFGDTTDGVSSVTGSAAPVTLASTATAVTDHCKATPAKVKNIAVGLAAGLSSGHPTVKIKVKTGKAFRTLTLGLPGGLKFVKSKKLVKEISGAKIKSVRIAGGKLVISLRSSLRSETIQTKSGLINESSSLIKSIKKHRTKKLTFALGAGSASLRVRVNA